MFAKKCSTTDLIPHWCFRMTCKIKLSQNIDIQNRKTGIGIPDSAHSSTFPTRPVLRKFSRNVAKLGPRARMAARNARSKHSQCSCFACNRSDPAMNALRTQVVAVARSRLSDRGVAIVAFDRWVRGKKTGETKSAGGPPPILTLGVAEVHVK